MPAAGASTGVPSASSPARDPGQRRQRLMDLGARRRLGGGGHRSVGRLPGTSGPKGEKTAKSIIARRATRSEPGRAPGRRPGGDGGILAGDRIKGPDQGPDQGPVGPLATATNECQFWPPARAGRGRSAAGWCAAPGSAAQVDPAVVHAPARGCRRATVKVAPTLKRSVTPRRHHRPACGPRPVASSWIGTVTVHASMMPG